MRIEEAWVLFLDDKKHDVCFMEIYYIIHVLEVANIMTLSLNSYRLTIFVLFVSSNESETKRMLAFRIPMLDCFELHMLYVVLCNMHS